MADIFISYSRKDQDFVRRLHDVLKQQNREIWVDWEGILPSAEWLREIYNAIDSSDIFVFVISPDSVHSDICRKEFQHAVEHNKRLVPILYRDVEEGAVPEKAASHNWIYFRECDDFDLGIGNLLKAVDTDLEWVHEHTRLLTRALEWDRNQNHSSFALRSIDLKKAQQWLARAGLGKEPRPTPLQTSYILASQRDAGWRQRVTVMCVAIAVLIAVVLGSMAWQRAQQAKGYLASDYEADAFAALADNDVLKAQVLLATSLTLGERRVRRERLLQARAKSPLLNWVIPRPANSSILAISLDGQRFLLKDKSSRLHVWDTARRKSVITLPNLKANPPAVATEPLCAAFTHPSGVLAVGDSSGMVQIWDVSSSVRPLILLHSLQGHQRSVMCMAFTRDGSILISGGKDANVNLWEVASGKLLRSLDHREQILSVAVSPDGSTVAAGTRGTGVRVWDARSGKQLFRLTGHDDSVSAVAFSLDGRLLASGSRDTKVWLWDVKTGLRLRQLNGHQGAVISIAFDPSGRTLITGSEDRTVRRWEVETGKNQLTLRGHEGPVSHVAVDAAAGQLLVAGGTVHAWDIDSIGQRPELRTLYGHSRNVSCVAFSPKGQWLASGSVDYTIRLWEVQSGRLLRVLQGHLRPVVGISFSSNGQHLASASRDDTVRVWIAGTGKCVLVLRHPAPVWATHYSPDGRLLATACDDGHLRMWDAKSGKLLRTYFGHEELIYGLGFSPNSKWIATASDDGTSRVWDVATGGTLAVLQGHNSGVRNVIFRHDGRLIASCGYDGTVRLWDVTHIAKDKKVCVLRAHEGTVWDMSWSPDGTHLVSGGQDAAVRLWQVPLKDSRTAREVLALRIGGPIQAAEFSPNGRKLAVGSQDRTVRIWDIGTIEKALAQPAQKLLRQTEQETGLTIMNYEVVPIAQPSPAPAAVKQ